MDTQIFTVSLIKFDHSIILRTLWPPFHLFKILKFINTYINNVLLWFLDFYYIVFMFMFFSFSILYFSSLDFIYLLDWSKIFFNAILPNHPPPPSPTESKRLFYISVSLLLSRIQGCRYHLSKFHIYVLIVF